jgi:hypothetical protein
VAAVVVPVAAAVVGCTAGAVEDASAQHTHAQKAAVAQEVRVQPNRPLGSSTFGQRGGSERMEL